MRKGKTLVLALLISFFFIPSSISFAQDYTDSYENPFITTPDSRELTDEEAQETIIITAISLGILLLVVYISFAIPLAKLGKEMNYEHPSFAWIPLLQFSMVFKLGNQNPWLALIFLVPGIGTVVFIAFWFIAFREICIKRGYDKALALLVFVGGIGPLILLYLLAFKDRKIEETF